MDMNYFNSTQHTYILVTCITISNNFTYSPTTMASMATNETTSKTGVTGLQIKKLWISKYLSKYYNFKNYSF